MRIALAFAPGLQIEKTLPPIGIATLSAFLKAHGYRSDLYDLNLELALQVTRPDLEDKYTNAVKAMRTDEFFDPEHVAEFCHYSDLNEAYITRKFYELMKTGLSPTKLPTPLTRFIFDVSRRLASYDLVGFSVIFPSQIPAG